MKHLDPTSGRGLPETASVDRPGEEPQRRIPWRVKLAGTGAGLLLLLAAPGCSVHYDVLLNNGDSFTAYSKPKPDGRGRMVFKNSEGEQVSVSELRVLEIRAK